MGTPYSNPLYGLFTLTDFMAYPWPEREVLMAPWLLSSSITMLYAKAGVGKSNLVLGMALAMVRREEFLGFTPTRPLRVLYVDGEMPPQELKRRMLAMTNGQPVPDGLMMVSVWGTESKDCRLPSLNTPEGQEAMERYIDDAMPDVVILDNKSTLMSNARENEAGSWDECQRWLMTLRASGLAMILLHHAGKNGQQRGSSALEVSPEIILELYEPEGPEPEEGSHFVLAFEKKRHVSGKAAKAKLVKLNMQTDSVTWAWEPFKGERKADPRRAQAIALRGQGMGVREIARAIEASPSTVSKWAKQADAQNDGVRCSPSLGLPNSEHSFDGYEEGLA